MIIAQASSTAPYITPSTAGSFERVNGLLSDHLGSEPLTEKELARIIEAGVHTVARADSDATVAGVRAALSEVRAEWNADRERMQQTLSEAQSRSAKLASTAWSESDEFRKGINTAANELLTGLPSTLQKQLAPHLDEFQLSLVTAARTIMDPTATGGAGSALVESIRATLEGHYDRTVGRLSDLEVKIGVAQAREEQREISSAKGMDFENELEELLAEVAEELGVLLRATGGEVGAIPGNKKGDFVFRSEHGDATLVAVEAKNRRNTLSKAHIQRDMDEMLKNRVCSVGVWVVKGRDQNNGQVLTALSTTRWIVALDDDSTDLVKAIAKLAVSVARSARTGGHGDADTARLKVQEALTAASDMDQLKTAASAVVKSADTLNEKVIAVRTRVVTALQAATEALLSE